MARKSRKRKYVRIPGLSQAARALGVSYSHLRRVIDGERRSGDLLVRYEAYKAATAKGAEPNMQYPPEFQNQLLSSLATLEKDIKSVRALLGITAARMEESCKDMASAVGAIEQAKTVVQELAQKTPAEGQEQAS